MAYTAALVQRGNRITYTNNTLSIIGSKQVVIFNAGTSGKVGITVTSIAVGATGEIDIGGGDERVWTLPKKAGDIFNFGDSAYWDPINQYLTTTTLNNTKAGLVALAPSTAATSVTIVLNN